MPKLKPATQRQRREHILDAAEHCFARSGFHRTTMQDICKEASISPGALYVYFDSKEALIAGLCERDRSKLQSELGAIAAAPDLMQALEALGQHYFIEQPREKAALHLEIGAETTRNCAIAGLHSSVDCEVRAGFAALFERARQEGRIAPAHDSQVLADVLSIIGDGVFWRRAVDPTFDVKPLMPVLTGLIATLINPVPGQHFTDTQPATDTPQQRGGEAVEELA